MPRYHDCDLLTINIKWQWIAQSEVCTTTLTHEAHSANGCIKLLSFDILAIDEKHVIWFRKLIYYILKN